MSAPGYICETCGAVGHQTEDCTYRVTRKDLDKAFEIHWRTLHQYDLVPDGRDVVLDYKYSGQSIWIRTQVPGTRSFGELGIGDAFLGRTDREAYEELISRTSFLHSVFARLKDQGRLS